MKNIMVSFVFALCAVSCAKGPDFSGTYTLSSGECTKKIIQLKKVQGFQDKYYTVTVKDSLSHKGDEFLGVVNGNRITVQQDVLIIEGDRLKVHLSGKDCLYILKR